MHAHLFSNTRRALLGLACCLGLSAAAITQGATSTWPKERPIRLVVGWPPGGGADIVARMMAKYLSDELKQSIVVENRAGAGGVVGTQEVTHAAPDGYTMLMASDAELTIAPAVRKATPYDPVKDLTPISLVSEGPFMLVANASFPPNSLDELVKYAKAHPGQVNYGSFGLGTNGHMLGEQLKAMAGINTVHVPYKGSAPALTDLIGGHIQYAFFSPMAVVQMIQQGSVKGIALLAPKPLPGVDSVPTSEQDGLPALVGGTRFGLLAPPGTPEVIVDRMQHAVAAVLARPEVRSEFEKIYTVPIGSSPADFRKFIAAETSKWTKLGQQIHLNLD